MAKTVTRKRILLVDDEPNVLKLLKTLFDNEGYDAMMVLGGAEALAAMRKSSFDLVLVDFFMPDMNGRELCERIRKNEKWDKVKLIFVTVAEFGLQAMQEMKRLRISDYVPKPFDNKDLVKRVKKALG